MKSAMPGWLFRLTIIFSMTFAPFAQASHSYKAHQKSDTQTLLDHLIQYKKNGVSGLNKDVLEDVIHRFPFVVGSYNYLRENENSPIFKKMHFIRESKNRIAIYHNGKKQFTISNFNTQKSEFTLNKNLKIKLNMLNSFEDFQKNFKKVKLSKQHRNLYSFIYSLLVPEANAAVIITTATIIAALAGTATATAITSKSVLDVGDKSSASSKYSKCTKKLANIIEKGTFVFSEKKKICAKSLKKSGDVSSEKEDDSKVKQEIDVSSAAEGEFVDTHTLKPIDIARGYMKNYDKDKFSTFYEDEIYEIDMFGFKVFDNSIADKFITKPETKPAQFCDTVISDFKFDLKTQSNERAKELHARLEVLKEQKSISVKDSGMSVKVTKCAQAKLKDLADALEKRQGQRQFEDFNVSPQQTPSMVRSQEAI